MMFPFYLRKSGSDKVNLFCLVELIQETENRVEFRSQEFLSVDLHSHYYVKRKSPKGTLELWSIEFFAATEMQPPYIYTGTRIEKLRDVASDWVSDE